MGIFGSLFGGSSEKSDAGGVRCMDCGMAGGTHTDWCPTNQQSRSEDQPQAVPAAEDRDEMQDQPEGQA